MREVIRQENFAFDYIYSQLKNTDFTDIKCSPLINGAPGLGKTTACVSSQMYELYQNKLNKISPQILVVESRAMTRDQMIAANSNPNIHFKQFAEVSLIVDQLNFLYDIIILDEAHSLFTDAEFAAASTAPICDWLLNYCRIFQIYITASDIEFIQFAKKFFIEKDFLLTFPDINKVYAKYLAQKMILSINTIKTEKVIEKKENIFFKEKEKGVFFVLSAKEAYSLYEKYSTLGYSCGFYISQSNSSQIVKREEIEEDSIENFTSQTWTTDISTMYQRQEKERIARGLETIKEGIEKGYLPADIQYLFITDVGQEGISLKCDNSLTFIFIEDTYPLKINQKLFRYRENVPLVYVSIPQRRLEKMFIKALEKLSDMMTWSQEKLEGYYIGANSGKRIKDAYANAVWYDKMDKKYKVATNLIVYMLTASEGFRLIRDSISDEQEIIRLFGQYAEVCMMEDLRANSIKDRVVECIENFKDKEMTKEELEVFVEEIKKCGLTNKKGEKDYSYLFVKKYLEEENIAKLQSKKRKIKGKQITLYKVISFLDSNSEGLSES